MQKEDVWVHTSCDQCLGECGILVHRIDGIAREIKGDPDCPNSNGRICSKGHAGIMNLYDNYRVRTPMKRTNPEKGLGIDPKWVPISWNEAIDILVEKLDKVKKEDPRKLVISSFDTYALVHWAPAWTEAFGTPNVWIVYFCGQYLHSSMYLTNGTFHCDFDPKYCQYLMLVGNQVGFGMGLNPNISAQNVADARRRGMRVVAIDPICNHAGSKADEWVPIRPGTDAALMLSMANVLVNELGMYDLDFLKKYTNGPYLVKPDHLFMRKEGKPVMWDPSEGRAKPYDDNFKDYALEGTYEVDGVTCRPAFHLLKEHLKKYTPEMASEITTVPAETIRRIAREFGEAARIGSTIKVDGHTFPYRPVAVNIYRGAGAHKHGVGVALLTQLMNLLVGALYVPGSHRGTNAVGPRENRDPLSPGETPAWSWTFNEYEGLVAPTPGLPRAPDYYRYKVGPPQTVTLRELYPLSSTRAPTGLLTSINPEAYKLPYKPEVLLVCRRNMFTGGCDYKVTSDAMKAYKFMAVFATHFDEMTEFADLVLPEKVGLEKLQVFPNLLNWGHSNQTGYWYWGLKQPAVEPMGEARDWQDVLMEVADRMDFLKDVYERFNASTSLSDPLKEPYKLDTSRKYTPEEIADRRLKSRFGDGKGLDWFKKNGYVSYKRTADEQYPLPWLKVRFPIYHELYVRAKKDMEELVKKLDLKDWDLHDYVALPEWKACASYVKSGEFNLTAVNFRVPTHAQSITSSNAWLSEVAEFNPYAQKILINTGVAGKRGIKEGDKVCIESEVGKVTGIAKVTECIHPEAVGISSHFGTLAKGMPIARGKGANLNRLLPLDMDPVSTGVDSCVKVKVYKAK